MPKPPPPGDTIGSIPPYQGETYIHRGRVEDEVRKFLRKGSGAGAILGLHAPGGLGKTELAKRVAEDLKAEFEGVVWVDVGERTAPQVVLEMSIRLGVRVEPSASYEQQKVEGADCGNFAVALLNLAHKAKAKEYAQKAKAAFEKIGEPSLLKQVNTLLAACEE